MAHFYFIHYITEPVTTVGTCTDDPGENCTRMVILFNICSEPHKAQHVCRKHCGLCDMGKHISRNTHIYTDWVPKPIQLAMISPCVIHLSSDIWVHCFAGMFVSIVHA